MGVKNLLAKQEAGFISLHEVLTNMTQTDGSSYQEAATALHRLLNESQSDSLFIWWTKTALNGVKQASSKDEQDAMACLAQAAKSGAPSAPNAWDEFDDQIPF